MDLSDRLSEIAERYERLQGEMPAPDGAATLMAALNLPGAIAVSTPTNPGQVML